MGFDGFGCRASEDMVHDVRPGAIVVRLNLVYGRSLSDSPSATDQMVAAAKEQKPLNEQECKSLEKYMAET